MYYVYVLQSQKTNKLYKGSADNLRDRFKQHNKGESRYTKTGIPWELIYYEAHKTKELARKAEIFYKKSQGRRQLKKKLGIEK